jgi:hypothetical protein
MRRLRLIKLLRTRRTAWPEVSGRETLAAAISRSRCVLVDGCPVLSVHFCFGLAPHMGQRTDNICPNVSLPGFTPTLFNIANWRDGQSSSMWDLNCLETGIQIGEISKRTTTTQFGRSRRPQMQ